MKKRFFWLMCAAIALIIGAILYGLYRQDTYVGKIVGIALGKPLQVNSAFSACMAYYLPDFLWMFALVCSLLTVMLPRGKHMLFWCLFAFLLGTLWELLQLWGVVPGTADVHDVILYSMAAITAAIISSLKKRRKTR